MDKHTFKLVIVGETRVGKTTFVKRHRVGDFENKHVATLGVEVHPLRFYTNKGEVCFNVWDCAGDPRFVGLSYGYYIQANCAMVFFDVTNRASFERVPHWIEELRRVCGKKLPIVVVGNKVDVRDRVVKTREIGEFIHANESDTLHYYDVSAKSNYNFEKPFLYLARTLTSHQDLQFVEAPPLSSPSVVEASSSTLPDRTLDQSEYLEDERSLLIQSLLFQLSDEGKEDELQTLAQFIRDLTC